MAIKLPPKAVEFITKQWVQVRGNAKWDAFKLGVVMLVIIFSAIVGFLRFGPAMQVAGFFILALASVLIWGCFGSQIGKISALVMAIIALLLLVTGAYGYYDKTHNSPHLDTPSVEVKFNNTGPAYNTTGNNNQIGNTYNSYRDTNAELEARKSAMAGTIKEPETHSEDIVSLGGFKIFALPGLPLFKDGSESIFSYKGTAGKLLVSLKIRNENGDLVAELTDNEWGLNKDAIFDRNYNDKAVEVRDRKGNIVLQVVDLGNIVYVTGIFRCSSGRAVMYASRNPSLTSETSAFGRRNNTIIAGDGLMVFANPNEPLPVTINQIFEYPSSLHLGSCPQYEKLKQIEDAVTNGIYGFFSGGIDVCQ